MRKLTKQQADEIRALIDANPNLKRAAVGRLFNVSGSTVSAIIHDHIHRDVDQEAADALANLRNGGAPPEPPTAPAPVAPKPRAEPGTLPEAIREIRLIRLELAQLQGIVERLRGEK